MCLILFSFQPETDQPLLVLANRDEFHNRDAAVARFWPEQPEILAGRDLQAGGTWLGVSRAGRFAAVTNFRDPDRQKDTALSRGELPLAFLAGNESAYGFADKMMRKGDRYNGFSLLVFDGQAMAYVSNHDPQSPRKISPGVHGLSNHLLNTGWPKVRQGKSRLEASLARHTDLHGLLPILADTQMAPDEELPDTGVGLEWERILSPACIQSEAYGTRCSTAVEVRSDGSIHFIERTLVPAGLDPDTVEFQL